MNKGDRTRQAVLDRALSLASTVGLEGLTIGQLARDVGMSKSGLFAHFDSKEALQLSVLETASARFVAEVISPALREPRGEPRVRALFENWLSWDSAPEMPGGCVFMSFAHELDDRPGALRDKLAAAQRDWVDVCTTAARIAVEEGHFRADVDPEQFVFAEFGVVLAYNHYKRLLRREDAEARADAAFEAVLRSARD